MVRSEAVVCVTCPLAAAGAVVERASVAARVDRSLDIREVVDPGRPGGVVQAVEIDVREVDTECVLEFNLVDDRLRRDLIRRAVGPETPVFFL